MNGILNSFSKPSKNVQDKEGESYTDAASKAEPKEPKVKKKLKTKTNTSVSSSASSNFSKSRKRVRVVAYSSHVFVAEFSQEP